MNRFKSLSFFYTIFWGIKRIEKHKFFRYFFKNVFYLFVLFLMCSFLISSHLVHQVSQNYQKKQWRLFLGTKSGLCKRKMKLVRTKTQKTFHNNWTNATQKHKRWECHVLINWGVYCGVWIALCVVMLVDPHTQASIESWHAPESKPCLFSASSSAVILKSSPAQNCTLTRAHYT